MAYDFKKLKAETAAVLDWLAKELTGVRTGRASPALLDSVQVAVYGTTMQLAQVASVTIEDARTLRISPWDTATTKDIERSITAANIGISPTVDEKGIRLIFPEVTGERRAELIKVVRQKLEGARVSLRKAREDAWNDIQSKEKNSEISEDEKFRAKEEMQKIIDEGNKALEVLAAKKETELTNL